MSTNNSGIEVDTEGKQNEEFRELFLAAGRLAATHTTGKRRDTKFHLPKSESKGW